MTGASGREMASDGVGVGAGVSVGVGRGVPVAVGFGVSVAVEVGVHVGMRVGVEEGGGGDVTIVTASEVAWTACAVSGAVITHLRATVAPIRIRTSTNPSINRFRGKCPSFVSATSRMTGYVRPRL